MAWIDRLSRNVRRRTLARSAALAGLVLAFVGPVAAETQACRLLMAEMANLEASGTRASTRRYDAAIERQREQLDLALRHADRIGCAFVDSEQDICRSLSRTIERMERNLSQLEDDRAAAATTKDRDDLFAEMEVQDCGLGEPGPAEGSIEALEPYESPTEEFDQASSVEELDSVQELDFGEPGSNSRIIRIQPSRQRLDASAYRTACVRTCDGYIFPMSPMASAGAFGQDQRRCEAACPGTDVRLYYQAVRIHDPKTMLAASTGERYGSLPNAFLYRQSDWKAPAGCGCGANPGFPVAATTTADAANKTRTVPPPLSSPDPDRKVRVVGPAFFPDPSTAIVPQAPGRTQAP